MTISHVQPDTTLRFAKSHSGRSLHSQAASGRRSGGLQNAGQYESHRTPPVGATGGQWSFIIRHR